MCRAQQRSVKCPLCDLSTASLPLAYDLVLLDSSGCDHECALEQLASEFEVGGMTVGTFKTKDTLFYLCIVGLHTFGIRWSMSSLCSHAVLYCCGKGGTHLWLQHLGSDQKNKVMDKSSCKSFPLQDIWAYSSGQNITYNFSNMEFELYKVDSKFIFLLLHSIMTHPKCLAQGKCQLQFPAFQQGMTYDARTRPG